MAAEVNARHNKHPTIAFTLPISCQVCLGKVKSPVLCPNNHVFCSTCLDVWLQKNKHCPACRANMTSPKKIMGGINHQESESDKLTNPDLRKARFDLLYKEYENEFERMHSEIQLLRTENQILKQQSRSDGLTSSRPSQGESSKSSEQLLYLTKKLQEATKLYEKMKGELTRVKQENTNLKDENVSLNRENQNLRQELAGRSPHRYGRITVQTLESKLASAEKDVTRLTKALERSDQYIEELEKERDEYKGRSASKEDKYSMNGDILARKSASDSKVPQPKDYGIRGDNSSKRQLFSEDKGSKSNSGERSKYYYDRNGHDRTDLRDDFMDYETDKRSAKVQSAKTNGSNGGKKRVTFDLDKNTDTTAVSFELEMPSPVKAGRNSSANRSASPVKGVLKKGNDRQSSGTSNSKYDGYTSDLSKTLEEDSLSGSYNQKPSDRYSKDDDLLYRKGKSLGTDRAYDDTDGYSRNRKKYSADDSVLSQPSDVERKRMDDLDYLTRRSESDYTRRSDDLDYRTGQLTKSKSDDLDRSDLDDTNYIESELDDLNISLTPEFTDCMKLLNRAEKKVHGGTEGKFEDTPTSYKTNRDSEQTTYKTSSELDAVFRASTGSMGYKGGSGEDFLSNYKSSETDRFAASLDTYSRGRHVRTGSLDNIVLATERESSMAGDLTYRPSSALPSTSNMYSSTAQSKYSTGLTTGRTTLSRTPSVDNLLMNRPSSGTKYTSMAPTSGLPSRLGPMPSYKPYSENSDKLDVNGAGISTGGSGMQPFPAKHSLGSSSGDGGSLDRNTGEQTGRVTFDSVLQARGNTMSDFGSSKESLGVMEDRKYASGRSTPTLLGTGSGSDFDFKYTSSRDPATDLTSRNGMGSGRSTPTLTHTSDSHLKANSQFSDYKYMGNDLSLKPPIGTRQSDLVSSQPGSSRMTNSTNYNNTNPAPSYTNNYSSTASSYTDPTKGYTGMSNYSLGGGGGGPSNGVTNTTGTTGGGTFYDGTKYEGRPFSLSSNSKLPADNFDIMNDKDFSSSNSNYKPSASSNVPAYNDYNYRDGTDFANFSTKVSVSSLPLPVPSSSSTANPSSGSFAGSTYGSSSTSSLYPSSSYLQTAMTSVTSIPSYSTAHSVPFTYTSSSYTSTGPANTYTSKTLDPIAESSNHYSYVSNASGDFSSKNDTFALPEPKKRLFDNTDELDMSVSPIKANRRF